MIETPTDLGKANQVVLCTNGQSWQRTLDNKLAVRTGVMENMNFNGVMTERIVGRGWELLAGQDDRTYQDISCGKDGVLAAVDSNGLVYVRTGVNMDTPHGTDWLRLSATPIATQVTVGEQGQMFVLDDNNVMSYVASVAEDASALQGLEGEWLQMDAGNNELFAIDMYHAPFHRIGITLDNPMGTAWENVVERCESNVWAFVSTAENGVVWAIDPQ
jgi:hypothetical protein